MTDLDDFLPKVLPFAPGCPEPVAFEHIRNAAIEFCRATKLWRFEDAFDLGEDPNLMCAPAGSVILDIERCDVNRQRLEPRSTDWLDEHVPNWRHDDGLQSSGADYFTQVRPGSIRVVPHCTGRVQVWLRLVPSEDAEQLPDFLADEHRSTIGHGALSGILMLPNQSFTDPNRATYFRSRFDSNLLDAKYAASTGQQRAPIRTKPRFF